MLHFSWFKSFLIFCLILFFSFVLYFTYQTSRYYNAAEQPGECLLHSGEFHYSLSEKSTPDICAFPKSVDTMCYDYKFLTGCVNIGDIAVPANHQEKIIINCPHSFGSGRWVLLDLNHPSADPLEDLELHTESKFTLQEGRYRLLFIGKLFSGKIHIHYANDILTPEHEAA